MSRDTRVLVVSAGRLSLQTPPELREADENACGPHGFHPLARILPIASFNDLHNR